MNINKALKMVRDVYGKDNYITGMTQWDGYAIFHLIAKDPNHEMEFNTPFSVVVNNTYQVGFYNLAEKARSEGRIEEYKNSCRINYRELDRVPEEEQNSFINRLKGQMTKKEAV